MKYDGPGCCQYTKIEDECVCTDNEVTGPGTVKMNIGKI